ncbi:MAG: SURF1 family protein [Gammaproteobacteria bacterium]|nr:SURF1 family protein [Gammaproteobacteria bacterium]
MLTIMAISVFVMLGIWQLDRADSKNKNYQRFFHAEGPGPVDFLSMMKQNLTPTALQWRHVSLAGEFAAAPVLLLDNQVFNGDAGYNVIAGFRVDGSEKSVLINLGWIGAGQERNTIPTVDVPTGRLEMKGWLQAPVDNRFIDETVIERLNDNIFRMQEINIEEVSAASGTKHHPFIILLDPGVEFGYARDWAPSDSEQARHQAYAFQWFSLAFFVLAAFMILNLKKQE